MKLMTKEIAGKLAAADKALVESGMEDSSDEIIVKYFNPVGAATWYITSGTPLQASGEVMLKDGLADYSNPNEADDWHLFGFADLGLGQGCAELGYVMLSELESYKGPFGLGIERDLGYSGSLKEVMAA